MCLSKISQMKRYISREGEQAVRQFKYKGGDLSISYEYLWSPLAEKVLQLIPPTIAPNTITLTAFVVHSLTTILLISFTPFTTPAPSWMLFLYGLSLLTYQTLDNVDGKQARKLQNSTPLGMIMDHGCDALTLLFCAASVARILCVSNFTLLMWTFAVGVTYSFYISAWCQYYSNGVMILGKINAVDDGIPGVWLLAFYSAFFGQDLWLTPVHLLGNVYLLNEVILSGIILAGIIQAYSIMSQASNQFTRDVGRAILDLLHLAAITLTLYLLTFHTDLCEKYSAGLLIAIGFMMARTISYTLLCTVAEMKFQQIQPAVIAFCGVFIGYTLIGQRFLNPILVVYGVAAFVVAEYSLFVVSVVNQIASILDIRVFHVFPPKTNAKH